MGSTATVKQGASCPQAYGEDAHNPSVGAGSAGFKPSGKGNPCPICSRTEDSDCRIGAELVLCHYGSRHHPPEGLRPGDTHTGGDGQQWAYTKDTSDGRAATFTPHKPLQAASTEPPTRGAESVWRYSATFYVCRFPNKRIRPLTWVDGAWLWKAPEGNRPMLLSHPLAAKPEATVLIVEGEKTWDAAQKLFPDLIACCWSGGCKAISKTNFTPLAGRKVTLWPDNDDAGRDAMERLAQVLYGVGAASVKVVANPNDEPQGWDLADANWTASEAAAWVKANTSETTKTVNSDKPKPKAERKARHLSHTKAMACFDRCVEVQAQRERNSLRRRARLLKAAKDLGLAAFINRQEISQKVLEAKARCGGEGFKPLTAADRAAMPKPVVRWLVRGLIPANDLTIIGGRPKVGKTRVAVAIVAAVLRGEPFLEFPVAASAPPVLLVTDDQSAGDTADMLTALDLWTHPRLVTSEHFRLTETDLDALLEAIKANPGALVVLDSLRSISRALQHGENDPEIGATLYDLKQAVVDAGGTLLLIHHCNKAPDLVGVEALSGHGAIAGAANTVITLHHCPNDKGLPDKINPQRRLFSQGRSGEDCDLVIDRGAGAGTYRQVSTFDHWQQQLSEAKKNQKLERLTELQQQALNALSDSGQWMTRRQVCDAIGVTWTERGRSGEARKVGDSLHRLVELEEVESQRAGTEATFRASCETQKDTVTTVPVSDANESQCHEPLRDNRDNRDMARLSQNGRDTETDCDDSLARLSRMSQPISDPQRQENEQRIRALRPGTADMAAWPDDEVAELRQSLEQAAKRRASGFAIPVQEVA